MGEEVCDAFLFMQGNVADCQSTVRERLELLAGKGGAQDGLSACNGLPPESVHVDFGSGDYVVLHIYYLSLKKCRKFKTIVVVYP